ncbi:hypothetical protein [Williamsia deligens]|uniref:Uncharacterized protein n=1 Tax=Williamsia deligens TaxID=321325 RepID=A0ABW3GA26_9NOCA|nr:hypothetical protein [Williamsia deligens]MCP2193473.1 hypothetical protein [Williamsia deligens]
MAVPSMRLPVLSLAAVAAGLLLAGCGSDSGEVAGTVSSTSSAATASSPASAESTAIEAPTSTDPSAQAVPGPRLPAATSIPASKEEPTVDGTRCDTANGPEGALRVVILSGATDCGTVMPVARRFGPLISTGRNQDVGGWSCGPSQTTGVLAKCTRGDAAFGFLPQ